MSEEIKEELPINGEHQALDVNQLQEELERLKSTNDRLLQESKSNKTKRSHLEDVESKLKDLENQKLQEEGNWQEMLKREREEKSTLQQKLMRKDEKILKSNIFNTVSRFAKDAHDVADLLAQSEYASLIEVDEETLEPISESVKGFVGKLRDQKPYLFKGKKVASMADSKASIDTTKQKPIDQMSKDEREELMRAAISKW